MAGATEGGAVSGISPTNDPTALLLIQILLIITTCQLLAMILRRIRQPSVIAEIIAGIVLGPSVFGYIPGYIDALFPSKSLPTLQMIALLGLIFYLFIVGLELDVSMLQRRFRQSVAISLAGMLIPFALSTGTAYLLWKIYVPTQSFGSFYLFLGTAMSITAFPVLARILGELHLFTTPVGAQTIAAAAVDDCAAWGLLALVMGIVSATTPLNALYIILLTLAFFLFMMSIIRPLISRWFSGGLSEDGTVAEWVVITALLLVIASALLTQIIGVHAIFGGFIAGLIMPREHNLPIALTEKIEDLVSKLLLPLYFAYSGLRTNIGQLQDAEAWGMVVLVVATACVGKILGCFLAARMTRLNNREALAVGLLMNCKGLVELIVLNVGLDAEVINSKIFTIMVLMAIITTFITTPSVMWVYPSTYYRKRVLAADGSRMLDGGASDDALALTELGPDEEQAAALDKILDRFNPLVCVSSAISFVPTLMHLMQLIAGNGRKLRKTPIHVARMVEASERSSSIIKATHQTETFETDALLQMFRTFGRLTHVEVRSHLTIATKEDIAMDICEIVDSNNLDCLIIPWQTLQQQEQQQKLSPNTFLAANGSGGGGPDAAYWNTGTGDQNYIVRALLRIASRPVAVVCDRGVNLTDHDSNKQSVSILVPFFGGPDCREALRLALRLGRSAGTSVHILHIMFPADTENESSSPSSPAISSPAMFDNRLALPMIVSGARSSTPERLAPISDADRSLLDQVKAQISQRTLIDELSYETIVAVLGEPLERIVDRAKQQPFSLIIFGFLGAKWSIYSRQTGVDINSNQLGTAMMESLGHEYNNTSTMRSPNVNRRNSFTVHSRPPTNTEPSQLTLRSLFGAGSGIGGNNQHQQDRSGQQQNDNAIYSSRTAALGELGRRLLLDEQSIKSSLISVRSVRLSS